MKTIASFMIAIFCVYGVCRAVPNDTIPFVAFADSSSVTIDSFVRANDMLCIFMTVDPKNCISPGTIVTPVWTIDGYRGTSAGNVIDTIRPFILTIFVDDESDAELEIFIENACGSTRAGPMYFLGGGLTRYEDVLNYKKRKRK